MPVGVISHANVDEERNWRLRILVAINRSGEERAEMRMHKLTNNTWQETELCGPLHPTSRSPDYLLPRQRLVSTEKYRRTILSSNDCLSISNIRKSTTFMIHVEYVSTLALLWIWNNYRCTELTCTNPGCKVERHEIIHKKERIKQCSKFKDDKQNQDLSGVQLLCAYRVDDGGEQHSRFSHSFVLNASGRNSSQ